MKIVKNAVSKIDFTFASVSIQDMMNLFTNVTPSIINAGEIDVTKLLPKEPQSTGYSA